MSDFTKLTATLSPEQRALLLARMRRLHNVQREPGAGDIPRQERTTNRFPLSYAQQRLWFLEQFQQGGATYHVPAIMRLQGELSIAALQQGLRAIVQRHEALRTTFTVDEGRPLQVIVPCLDITFPVTDCCGLPADERADLIRQLAAAIVRVPFDLARGPLIRVALLRLDALEHVLIIVMHHIISDGWSAGVFIRELAVLYQAYDRGQAASLPELPIQYADFAYWERQRDTALDTKLAYWVQQLKRAPTCTLPTDHPRPRIQTFNGSKQSFVLSKRLTQSLHALSRQEDVTLFMTLLAAFKALLFRYTGQEDVVIGTRVANRNHVQTEHLIGFFVNGLVLRTDLTGCPTFRKLLKGVREVALDAYAHQDVPFEKLVEVVQPRRELNNHPLFQIMFVLQNMPIPALELPDLHITPLNVETTTAKFDIDCSLIEDHGQLKGDLEYNTDLFDAATITRLLDHFQTLLESIVADPAQRVMELSIMTDRERHQLLIGWNSTTGQYPGQGLHELFAAQVARTPDAIAVIYDDAQVTYQSLNDRANRLAHHLQAAGVAPEVIVGVCLTRSLQTVVALLAIIKAGGTYLPLDPAYPAAHLRFMLQDTLAPVIITEQPLISHLGGYESNMICLDTDQEIIDRTSRDNPINRATISNTVHVMYTSGSTGQPKGVAVPQEQLLNRFAWMWRAYPFAAHDVMCQKTTVNFSVSMWEFLGSLLQGIPLAIMPDAQDPERFVRALGRHHVTRIVLVPSLLRVILDSGIDLQQHLSHVHFWSICGEALTTDLVRRFYAALPHATLINQYGASEVNDILYYDTRSDDLAGSYVPIGRPIPNTHIYLLDRALQPVPIGVPGELYVSSPGLGRGYFKRPDLTAERFIPNPFAGIEDGGWRMEDSPPDISILPSSIHNLRSSGDRESKIEDSTLGTDHERSSIFYLPSSSRVGGRLYRTGDIARYRSDGTIEHLGRSDHQVKLRGVRVELEGIERKLTQHPAVRQAVVLAKKDRFGDPSLIAYVVARDAAPLTSSDLYHFLKTQLPAAMLPTTFVVLPVLPLTPNGKIDRKALPEPQDGQDIMRTAYIAPRTEVEQKIADIWQSLLQLEKIGVDDNIFEIGGHSLLLARALTLLQESLDKELSIVDLFEYPTIRTLTERITQRRGQQSSFQEIQERETIHRSARRRRKELRQQQQHLQEEDTNTKKGGV